jgi:hypothetical protein
MRITVSENPRSFLGKISKGRVQSMNRRNRFLLGVVRRMAVVMPKFQYKKENWKVYGVSRVD